MSLQCINDNYIERYSFTTFGQNVKYEEQKEYLTSYFIDYYITVDSIEYFNNKRILVILSKEKKRYFSHIFEIQNEKIFWIDKMIVDTYHKNLREAKPIVPLAKTGWVVLIDETEKKKNCFLSLKIRRKCHTFFTVMLRSCMHILYLEINYMFLITTIQKSLFIKYIDMKMRNKSQQFRLSLSESMISRRSIAGLMLMYMDLLLLLSQIQTIFTYIKLRRYLK